MTDQGDADYEARRAKVAEEVKKLLAKAAATEFDEERETFENAAAKKMARWMINEAELRSELGAGAYGAGEILEEFYPVAWEDGCGVERATLATGIGSVFGVAGAITSTYDQVMSLLTGERKHSNVRASLIGTRAGLDATLAILPEQLVQCDAAAARAWEERLAARARLHEERSLDQYGYFRPPSGYSGDFSASGWSATGPWGAPRERAEPGLCNCGCGTPVDDPRDTAYRGAYSSAWRDPYTSGGASTYGDVMDALLGRAASKRPAKGPAKGSAAERLATERQRFMRSFIGGWAQRVEERLRKVHREAAEQEQDDADRMALVLKADADRAREELHRRYTNLVNTSVGKQDMAARSAGWSDAAGADLGGQRFDGGYGGRRELEA